MPRSATTGCIGPVAGMNGHKTGSPWSSRTQSITVLPMAESGSERAGFSPAFLSRILNKQRGLPSDKTILRLAQELNLEPRERLLIEAGRIPEELKRPLNRPEIPALLRAAGNLSETDLKEVIKTAEALVLKRQRSRKRT